MKNIVLLAAGPPKPNRNRHLEVFENQKLIDRNISRCRVDGTTLYVVVNKNNDELLEHLKSVDNVTVLTPESDEIRSTFETALQPHGDCVMVSGDLINLREGDIQKFVDSKFKSATCRYATPWGADVFATDGSLRRRADVGDCVNMISQGDKEKFLSHENYELAISLYDKFYGGRKINPYWYNDIGTFTSFAFYGDLWSTPNLNEQGTSGLILFEHEIYKDND